MPVEMTFQGVLADWQISSTLLEGTAPSTQRKGLDGYAILVLVFVDSMADQLFARRGCWPSASRANFTAPTAPESSNLSASFRECSISRFLRGLPKKDGR